MNRPFKFCPECGIKIEIKNAKFCVECGTSLQPNVELVPIVPQPFVWPVPYFPPVVINPVPLTPNPFPYDPMRITFGSAGQAADPNLNIYTSYNC